MKNSSRGSSATHNDVHTRLREKRASDRAPLETILRATQVFDEHEITIALELIDADASVGYRFIVAESDDRVAGYVCFGATPCTIGTWDLYWIAVDPALHGSGVGRRLMDAAVEEIRIQGGRLIVIETASKPSYDATRAFYARYGCQESARVKDFYATGDDKVIYTLALRS
ncbi:MAG: GNAT family N-acetyltransferase [Planctomycetes bacterium]|nr:GNAT family N-acetyltransferase [Planctomycetota bacterium]